jgi:acetyltransferase-like isoleucine patch superfamily enzyme
VTAASRGDDHASDWEVQAPSTGVPGTGGAASPAGPGRRVRRHRRWLNSAIHSWWNWTATHGAVGPGDRLAARFGAFGDGSCLVFPPGAIFGERWIRIGRDTLIGPSVSISAGMVPGQQMVTDPVVSIGDRCMIGRGSHIVGHFNIEIGDDVHTGPYVYITDQNHGYENPDEVVHVQWPHDVPVRIGTGSWLGTGVVILPGTELGRNVVVGAGAVVRGVFPDHCVIAGVPARVVRRYVPGSGWVTGGGSASIEGTAIGAAPGATSQSAPSPTGPDAGTGGSAGTGRPRP